jgi:hypothetical protein
MMYNLKIYNLQLGEENSFFYEYMLGKKGM